ncbi:MAG TPA: GspH/FimT family pseudopilin [Luteimonas sp.]|nr:GspH/FimT family pseudopilin [Luteimonas sp.]HRO25964.1 GspH/FimT family pseudopilin [Luteimonas sp.]HRP72578.1 GspH/FimT family pseudopilin [Luteimonas sp.]
MRCRDAGFTLLELLIAVAILVVIVGVAIPSSARMLGHLRTTAALESLTTHMSLARMAAVTRRRPTILCPSTTGTSCGSGTDWSGGWMLLVDSNGNRRPDPDDEVLRVDLTPTSRALGVTGTRGRPFLRYLPDGRSAGSNLTLSVCSRDGHLLGNVIVNNAGRPRSSRPTTPTPCAN